MKVLIILSLLLFLMAGCDREVDDGPLPSSHAYKSEIGIVPPAPGWQDRLPYEIPKPGSYTLPKISSASGGLVLGTDGQELELDNLLGDKIVLLTFIYSSCTDLNGCPLATAVFYKIKEYFSADPKLANAIRLISISFDPEHDTPKVMKLYGAGLNDGEPQWLFLTTTSEKALHPITERYGQMVIKEYDKEGKYTGSMAHVLRAFLIDRSKNIRQEYSVSYLHDDLVSTDIETLMMEDGIIKTDS